MTVVSRRSKGHYSMVTFLVALAIVHAMSFDCRIFPFHPTCRGHTGKRTIPLKYDEDCRNRFVDPRPVIVDEKLETRYPIEQTYPTYYEIDPSTYHKSSSNPSFQGSKSGVLRHGLTNEYQEG